MTKPFQFISEMQHTALEINDYQVISGAMEQSFGNLIFEGFLPSFKVSKQYGLVSAQSSSDLRAVSPFALLPAKDKTGLIRYTLSKSVDSICAKSRASLIWIRQCS